MSISSGLKSSYILWVYNFHFHFNYNFQSVTITYQLFEIEETFKIFQMNFVCLLCYKAGGKQIIFSNEA